MDENYKGTTMDYEDYEEMYGDSPRIEKIPQGPHYRNGKKYLLNRGRNRKNLDNKLKEQGFD